MAVCEEKAMHAWSLDGSERVDDHPDSQGDGIVPQVDVPIGELVEVGDDLTLLMRKMATKTNDG